MADGKTVRLLTAIWGQRKGFVFIPYKDLSREWHETPGIPFDGSDIPSPEELKADVYFCPVVFSKPRRKKEYALPTNVLWADLDPVHPNQCRLKPSVAWESSPGRYQALWFLTREVTAEEASALSKRIAYADGADKGGWDVTQVLRLPGTRNFKYESSPEVRVLWAKRSAYSPGEVKAAYPPVNGESHTPSLKWIQLPDQVISTTVASLPMGLRRRISASTTGADRSLELQKLTRDLLKQGLSSDVVSNVIQKSSWNKFAGRSDEHFQLLKQVESAQAAIDTQQTKQVTTAQSRRSTDDIAQEMEVHQWAGFMQTPTHLKWLVDDAWVDGSVGFISGRSKSYKTWIALDLALSLVSGQSFLGRYPVRRTGPVLLIQEEDPTAVLQERLRLIAKSKEMLPEVEIARSDLVRIRYPDYPLHIINLQGFNLGVEEKVDQVRRLIAEINPVMVILDPLVVLLPEGIDEFRGPQVSAVLQSVKMWREEFGCSVAIVHHWNKTKGEEGERFAEHMYGSFAFHAWLESALHVMPVIEEERERIDTVLVEREFKAAISGRILKLRFAIDTAEAYTYEVIHEDEKKLSPMGQEILDHIQESGTTGMSTPELVAVTGHQRAKIVEQLGRMIRGKLVIMEKGGGRGKSSRYWVPDFKPKEVN